MAEPMRLVIYRLDRQRYALPLATIERIVRAVEVTPLSNAPGVAIALAGATHVLAADKIADALVALVSHRNGLSRS